MLRPRDSAPDFSLPDETGRQRPLDSLFGPEGLVLFFYPGDFTPLCTREVCTVRDLFDELQRSGLAVAGVSPDDPPTHARFKERYGLGYPLLSDVDRRVIREYGASGPLGIGVRRTTYLISPEREILDAVRADFRIGAHARFISTRTQAARSASRHTGNSPVFSSRSAQPHTVTSSRRRCPRKRCSHR